MKNNVFNRQVHLTMYNSILPPDAKVYRDILVRGVRDIFERHAAVEFDTPVISSMDAEEKVHGPSFLDRSGAVAELPCNLTTPIAAFVGHYQHKLSKLKRYAIQHVLVDNGSAHYKRVSCLCSRVYINEFGFANTIVL